MICSYTDYASVVTLLTSVNDLFALIVNILVVEIMSTDFLQYKQINEVHMGERLSHIMSIAPHRKYSKVDLAKHLGYKDRNSIYQLIRNQSWTLDILFKVLDYLDISAHEFFGIKSLPKELGQTTMAADSQETYTICQSEIEKLERRVSMLEKIVLNEKGTL